MEGFFWLWFIPGRYVVYLPITNAKPLTLLLTYSRLILLLLPISLVRRQLLLTHLFLFVALSTGWRDGVRASFSIVRLVRFIGWLCNVALPFQLFVCSELLIDCATSRFLSIARLVRSIGWLCNAAHPFQLLLSILVVHPRSCLLKQQTSPVPQYHGDLRSHPSPCSIHHCKFISSSVPTFLFRRRCVKLDGSFLGRSFFGTRNPYLNTTEV